MRPRVVTQKHIVQQSRSETATVALQTIDILDSVQVQLKDAVDEVEEGSVVSAIFVELWLLDSANDGSFSVTLEKRPSGVAAMGFASSQALGTYPNKKNILYTTQGLSPNNAVGNPVPIIRNWFKIPKGKQRMGLGDKVVLNIANMGLNDLEFCGVFIYKEQK